jgi:hypothetical protein
MGEGPSCSKRSPTTPFVACLGSPEDISCRYEQNITLFSHNTSSAVLMAKPFQKGALISQESKPNSVPLHRFIRFIGVHQGAIRPSHLEHYFDEFKFRFNGRTFKARGLLFHRLMEQAVDCSPVLRKTIIGGQPSNEMLLSLGVFRMVNLKRKPPRICG